MNEYKIRNAHCAYYEGQTGLCRAKEFVKCNPVNCKLYTIDELSTIVDLQNKLQVKEQECEELKSENFTFEELIKTQEELIDKYKQALEEIEKICQIKEENSQFVLPSVWQQILDIIKTIDE